jgi:uroporphyrinogen-III decarboxylase
MLRMCVCNISFGYFQALMSFMGFTNGLIACMEEPEEVKELMHFLLEINLEIGKNIIRYYKPDAYNMGDDIAHERAPFVSEDVFLDIFEPVWRAEVAPFRDAGVPAEHHNCGKFETFVPYIVDMGYNAWDPAQFSNDLTGIKNRYGRKLTICTGIQGNGFCSWPETTEEEIRAEVRRVMDLYAPDGGYCFAGGILGPVGDKETAMRNEWIKDEYEKNKYNYYK